MHYTCVLAALVAGLIAAVIATPAEAQAFKTGGGDFAAVCDFARQETADPIVHPDHPEMSHLHNFFGNTIVEQVTRCIRQVKPGSVRPLYCRSAAKTG